MQQKFIIKIPNVKHKAFKANIDSFKNIIGLLNLGLLIDLFSQIKKQIFKK